MKFISLPKLGLILALSLLLVACSSEVDGTEKQAVNLAYVEWETEVASTHVVGQVLGDLGYDVTLTPLDNGIMWEALANGEVDGMASAWLPPAHAAQVEKSQGLIADLGENLRGGKRGRV